MNTNTYKAKNLKYANHINIQAYQQFIQVNTKVQGSTILPSNNQIMDKFYTLAK